MRFPRFRRAWFECVLAGALASALVGCGESERSTRSPAATEVTKAKPPAPIVETPAPVVVAPTPVVETPAPVAEPAVVVPAGYKARMKLARQLAKDGKPDDAELVFAAAAEIEPARAAPLIEIARLRIEVRDVAGARKHAEAAVELEPGASGAWNTLGRVELMDGDKLAAIAAFEKATEANPDNSYAWNNLGLVLSQLQRWEEAVAALERATGGQDPEPYMWNNLGVAYEKSTQIELAKAAYRQGAKEGSKPSAESLARLEGATPVGDQAAAPGEQPAVDVVPTPPPAPTP
jgi:tetratricopeptide (TPR) repeat protein